MWKLYYFCNNLTSSLICVFDRHPPSPLYLDPLYTGSTRRTHFHGGLYQNLFYFHENSIKQESAIICLLANRQSTLVQLCFAEVCSTVQSIHVSLRLHQTPLARTPWHRKWNAQCPPLSTFWLQLKSWPCFLQKVFTSIAKVRIASCMYGLYYPHLIQATSPLPFF